MPEKSVSLNILGETALILPAIVNEPKIIPRINVFYHAYKITAVIPYELNKTDSIT